MKLFVKDLIDTLISHNETVALWRDNESATKERIWKGMAHELPHNLLNQELIRIFGVIPESIAESDTINILCKDPNLLRLNGYFSYSNTRIKNFNYKFNGPEFANTLLTAKKPVSIYSNDSRSSCLGNVDLVSYDVKEDICTCRFELTFNNCNKNLFDSLKNHIAIYPAFKTQPIHENEDVIINELEYFYLSPNLQSFDFKWEEVYTRY